MYDYMKALQRQFETKPCSMRELSDEIDRTHKYLSAHLGKENRRLLLKLVDLGTALQCEATLQSFICGYRLACGIHRELAEEPMYSFAKEEEERASQRTQLQYESGAGDEPPNKE